MTRAAIILCFALCLGLAYAFHEIDVWANAFPDLILGADR